MSTRTTFGDDGKTTHLLSFTLHHAGDHRLTLETGEVFQNPAYAKTPISANLNIRPIPDGSDPPYPNEMRYFGAVKGDDYGSTPFIQFNVSIPASDYSVLLNNLWGGLLPSSVTVDLYWKLYDKASPLTFGHDPDGSEIIWSNASEQNRAVAVECIDFYYRLLGTADYDGFEHAAPTTTKASVDAASVAIVRKLTNLENAFTKGIGWIVTVIVVACVALFFARH